MRNIVSCIACLKLKLSVDIILPQSKSAVSILLGMWSCSWSVIGHMVVIAWKRLDSEMTYYMLRVPSSLQLYELWWIVWRIRGKIIRTFLCCIVYYNIVLSYMQTQVNWGLLCVDWDVKLYSVTRWSHRWVVTNLDHHHHHHHFRLIIMVDKRSHTIDNKIGAKWYIGLHGTRL